MPVEYVKEKRSDDVMKTRTVLDGNAFYEIDEECRRDREQDKGLQAIHQKSKEPEKTPGKMPGSESSGDDAARQRPVQGAESREPCRKREYGKQPG